jgi:hypothetical protein
MGNDQTANCVVRDHAAGIADDVRFAGLKAEKILDVQSSIHAGNDGNAPRWLDGLFSRISRFMHPLAACIRLIVRQELIGVRICHD